MVTYATAECSSREQRVGSVLFQTNTRSLLISINIFGILLINCRANKFGSGPGVWVRACCLRGKQTAVPVTNFLSELSVQFLLHRSTSNFPYKPERSFAGARTESNPIAWSSFKKSLGECRKSNIAHRWWLLHHINNENHGICSPGQRQHILEVYWTTSSRER